VNLTRTAAVALTERLNRYTNKEGLALSKMTMGMEVFLINVSKIIIVYLLAGFLGLFWQAVVTHFAFALTKRYSFGAHALSSFVCTVVCCVVFVAIPWLVSDMGINNIGVLAIFAGVILALYMYAPADTKAKPLIGAKSRALLKKKAVVCGTVLMLAALIVPDNSIKLLLALGAAFQCIAILPITYKILRRSERNYEKYEQA